MFFIAQVRLRLALDHQSLCLRLPGAGVSTAWLVVTLPKAKCCAEGM